MVVVILAVLAVGLFLDKAIKSGRGNVRAEAHESGHQAAVGEPVVAVRLGDHQRAGGGQPRGYKTPSAINVGAASLALKPSSLLSDKIIIKSINVQGPEITFETDLKNNNLSKILANVQEATGGGQKEPAKPQEPSQPEGSEASQETSGG